MKKSIPALILTAALTVTGRSAAQTQAWQTVDLHQREPGLSATATDIGTASDGVTLYSVGSSRYDTTGNYSAIVRKSTDSGVTWTDEDDYLENGWATASYRGFGSGADGIFACGELWDGVTGTKTWIVRQKSPAIFPNVATWQTIDAFSQGSTAKPSCGDVKVNPFTGDVYAVGRSNAGQPYGFMWAVRKKAVGQTNFTTVDNPGAQPFNDGRAIGFHKTAGVFVVGCMGNGSKELWTVRRSLSGQPGTWTTVDTFQDASNTYSEASAIVVSADTIYVGGRASQVVKGKTINNWVVRRSLNAGNTWATVDRFGQEPAPYGKGAATITGITLSPSGQVFVTGITPAPSELLVRKGSTLQNGTMSWQTSDQFQQVAGLETYARALTTDAFGNIFSAGQGKVDSSGLGYFLTRKLTGQQ